MISNIEAMPGGFSALSSVFQSMKEPVEKDTSTDEANLAFAERYGVASGSSSRQGGGLNESALPNPWAPPPRPAAAPRPAMTTSYNSSANMFGGGQMNPQSPPFDLAGMMQSMNRPLPVSTPAAIVGVSQTSKEKYKIQIKELNEMGFTDEGLFVED
jgi:hypothetical protein